MSDNIIPLPWVPAKEHRPLKTTAALQNDARRCQDNHLIGVIAGPAGIGKTTAWRMLAEEDAARAARASDNAQALTDWLDAELVEGIEQIEGRDKPGKPEMPAAAAAARERRDGPAKRLVFVVTANPTTTTGTRLLALIQEALGDDRSSGAFQSPDERLTRVLNLLRPLQPLHAHDPGPLLIVDEAQNLNASSLDLLRGVWDERLGPHREGSCGLVLSGNPTFAANLRGKAVKASFAQLTSRVGLMRVIEGPTRSDVLALCAQLGIGDAACQEFLGEIATKPGALRLVANVVANARLDYGGKRLTVAQLREAAESIGL